MKLIKNLTENFDEEIEEIMIENGTIQDEMVCEGHTIGSVPFTSNEERKEWVNKNAIVFFDDNYIYVVVQDKILLQETGNGFNSEDYTVQKVEKNKYEYLIEEE